MGQVVCIDADLAAQLINALDGIDERASSFLEDTELHNLLCDLLGCLKAAIEPNQRRARPISLRALLIEKFEEWNEEAWDEKTISPAEKILKDALYNSDIADHITHRNDAEDCVSGFLCSLGESAAIRQVQLYLCTLSDRELKDLDIASLANILTSTVQACGYKDPTNFD